MIFNKDRELELKGEGRLKRARKEEVVTTRQFTLIKSLNRRLTTKRRAMKQSKLTLRDSRDHAALLMIELVRSRGARLNFKQIKSNFVVARVVLSEQEANLAGTGEVKGELRIIQKLAAAGRKRGGRHGPGRRQA